jgi:hypothetical protein
VADRVAHLAHLTVASFPNRDDQQRSSTAVDHLDIGRACALAVDHNPAAQALQIVFVGSAGDSRFVDSRHTVPRMGQFRRKVAVVGQDQQSFGVEVEPADRVHVFAHADQVDHRRPPLRI